MAYQMLCCSLCLLAIVICEAIDKPEYQYQYKYAFCYTYGFYTPNSTYQNNLHTLLSNLTSNTQIDYGFYNFTYGQNSDQVYATGLCRGDITTATCRNCLNDIGSFVLKQCPNQQEAVGLYDKCVLHYSYRSIFGYDSYEYTFEVYYVPLKTNITNWDEYSDVLTKLLQRLKVKASSNDSVPNRKFAAGKAVSFVHNETIYAVVQCSPDVRVAECNDCLNGAILDIPKYCDKKSDCALIKFSCNIRYQNSSFYQHTPDELTLQLQLSPQGSPFPTPSEAINSSNGILVLYSSSE